jgi:hypothetical protein
MTGERRYSVEEANALLPVLAPMLERLREAHRQVVARSGALLAAARGNGGGAAGREVLDASREAARLLAQAAALGVIVRDPEVGLVDFPSEREGRPVYLCWRLGEPAVAWWHPLDTGFAGRRPL